MTLPCILAWAAVLVLLPVLILAWLTETQDQKIRRWKGYGMTQQAIADRLGITRYRVRQALKNT